MAQTPSYSERKVSLPRIRPSAFTQQPSDTLRTPVSRSASGLYGSPGSSFRIEDENQLIFEFGARYMRAGFAGEAGPRCTTSFSPDLWRRVGDYRQWELGYEKQRRRDLSWGEEYELWKPHVCAQELGQLDLDLGLVEDRIGKCVRDCENNYLLLDGRPKKVALVLPSSLPRPLVSVVLGRLFEGLQAVSVSLLPSSVMAATAAGVRSALVVNIGWHETTATAIYEYREVLQQTSIRAGQKLSEEFGKLLEDENRNQGNDHDITFENVEEVMTRMGWCQDAGDLTKESTQTVSIPLSSSTKSLTLPFLALAQPAEVALFASKTPIQDIDDHDQPLHHLIYNALLALPIDIRQICMSRILLTGGVSKLPGLKHRVLSEVSHLTETRGFNPVRNYGSANPKSKQKVDGPTPLDPTIKRGDTNQMPASQAPQEIDNISYTLSQQNLKDLGPTPTGGEIRGITSLGAWAGASLAVNQRVRGVVEIEKERFLQHGLVGGSSSGKKENSVVPEPRSRQSLGPNVKVGADRSSWTLGVWG